MSIELSTVLKAVSSIPSIANIIRSLALEIRIGPLGKGNIKELNNRIKEIKSNMKEFGILGNSIKDYIDILGLATDLNNRVDNLLKSTIPIITKTGVSNELLKREYDNMHFEFDKHLEKFFIVERNIDQIDVGKITESVKNINNCLIQGAEVIDEYDKLEKLLKDVSNQLNNISGISTTKINEITKHLIAYPLQLIE